MSVKKLTPNQRLNWARMYIGALGSKRGGIDGAMDACDEAFTNDGEARLTTEERARARGEEPNAAEQQR